MKLKHTLQAPPQRSRWQRRIVGAPLNVTFPRFLLPGMLALMLATGCKTAPPKGTLGYSYTVQSDDTIEAIAAEYRNQGVVVTADQILSANPGLKITTNVENAAQSLMPESGDHLFIPDQKRTNLESLKTKARRGDAEAQYVLAAVYEQGKDVPRDCVQSARWYSRAARQGLGKAQFWLGRLYETGRGVKTNKAEAIKWFQKSANHGYAEAQYILGNRYKSGDGVPKDLTTAAKWYRAAAGTGVPWAQFNLGAMCYLGEGVAQNHSEAFCWIDKAARKGLAEAQALLGALYVNGAGIEKDDVEAFKWFNQAALQGIGTAQSALGQMYAEGTGVEKDTVQAYKWFALAAGNGDESVRTNLSALEATMPAKELSQARQLVSEFKPLMPDGPSCSWSGDQTFSLKPESGTATGFFVTDDGYLVSNFHVVQNAGEIFLITPAGTLPAEVVKVDEASDLALLKATGQFSALPIADSRAVKLGSPVFTVGFPDPPLLGFSPKFARGDIAALAGSRDEPLRFQISVPIQPGNSGGALLDGYGNVVGIVSQKMDTMKALESNGSLPENVNYAVKSRYLLRLLESVPEISSKLKAPGTEEKEAEEIASEAEQSSVLILIYGTNL